MVEVQGSYCPTVEQKCLRWLDPDNEGVNGPVRCAEFAPTICRADLRPKHFCVDRFEWPNQRGVLPTVELTFLEMKANCEGAGKRLCTASELTFACEGPKMKPYPYGDGLHRDSDACNIDRPWIDPFAWRSPVTGVTVQPTPFVVVDQRVLAGSKLACVSDFGVYDPVGNADEWALNESGKPYASALSGGHWALGARARCRPKTLAHNERFRFYVTGGRCCKDP